MQALDWGVRGGESVSDHACSVTYSGPTAFSEMETHAVRTLMQVGGWKHGHIPRRVRA